MPRLFLAYLDWDYEGERIIGVFDGLDAAMNAADYHGNGGLYPHVWRGNATNDHWHNGNDGRVSLVTVNRCIGHECPHGAHSVDYMPPAPGPITHTITRHNGDTGDTVTVATVTGDDLPVRALCEAIYPYHGARRAIMADGEIIGYTVTRSGEPTYTFMIGACRE